MAGIPPDLDQIRCGPNKEQRENSCVDDLVQSQEKLRQGDAERDYTLAHLCTDSSLRISNHEKDEQLIHRPSDRRHFRLPRMAGDEAAEKRQQKEGNNVGGADVKTPSPPDDDGAKHPDNQQRSVIISPLNAQHRHCLRGQKQQHRDAKV